MNNWQRFFRAPQTFWFRRFLFQVHLWMGIGFGLYVLVISVSGSALLLKSPFYGWFEPKTIDNPRGDPLEGDALKARMAEVYTGYDLGFTEPGYGPNDATYIVLQKDGDYIPHYFNQYTGEDIGPARPWPIRAVEWVADVHEELLLGRRIGRRVNGVGGALFVLMSITGLIIWWQGRSRWYEGLIIKPGSSRSFFWQLHSFLGFWALILMLAWGISGFQLGFPRAVGAILGWFGGDPTGFGRGGRVLGFFRAVHFARFGGQSAVARWAWIVASFLPTLMFISGFVLWWRRVVRRWVRSWGRTSSAVGG